MRDANTDVVRVFTSDMDPSNLEQLDPPLVDAEALDRLTEATGEWEAALAVARAAMTRWPVLELLVQRCDTLVRQWWVYAQNDPYYRDFKADSDERFRAFDEAQQFITALREGITTRTIGQSTWRTILLRVMVGQRALATLDRQNDLFR